MLKTAEDLETVMLQCCTCGCHSKYLVETCAARTTVTPVSRVYDITHKQINHYFFNKNHPI